MTTVVAQDELTALIRNVTDLVAQTEAEREVIEAVLRSVFSAMERVAPNARGELQTLVDAFIADPTDKLVLATLGDLLRDARAPCH